MNVRSGQGSLSVVPERKARWVAAFVALWLILLLALAAWWLAKIFQQAQRIAELEAQLGLSAATDWNRTRLMLTGESSFFAILLVSLSLALAWLYWRENRRARGMQAFFASVTHELRTPLTSMRLQAEAIAEGDQRAELAQRLLQDSYRLESQIDKTLELARIEGGGPLSEQAIPLRGWLEQVIAKCAESHGRALEYVVRIPPALPAVSADAAAVQMILRNLIENSVRHSGRQPVHVELSARADDGGVVVDYSDDGSGLKLHGDPRLVGRLFGRGQTSNGTGVGLYLVRALMQRMGGKLQLGATAAGGFHASLWFAATIEN